MSIIIKDTEKRIYETTKWVETTLRKGTKNPKICRDMFLSEYRGDFKLIIVKNGNISNKINITTSEACRFQRLHQLKMVKSVFPGAYSYRTAASNELIDKILSSMPQKAQVS
jgi:hypothetical protein